MFRLNDSTQYPNDWNGFFCGILVAGIFFGLAVWAFSCQGDVIDARFLDRVKAIESGGDSKAVGDKGKSLGGYQLGFQAWTDVNLHRIKNGQKPYSYTNAFNPTISRQYCYQFSLIQSNRLRRVLGRAPSNAEIYSAYTQGFNAFRRRGYLLKNNPKTTQKALAKLNI